MSEPLNTTPLNAAHRSLGAKMVGFAGFEMPLCYPEGILAEHAAVRHDVGMFDVSHMGEIEFTGPGAAQAVGRLVTNDVDRLTDNQALYTVVCHPNGGIVDDCIVYRLGAEHFRIVVNASNIEKDFHHFKAHAGDLCHIDDASHAWALIAVQGPKARALVAELCGQDLMNVPSFGLGRGACAEIPVLAARTGYTGEDGFELFIPATDAVVVWEALRADGAHPVGLGARDTLRLEARLALYGNDIDDTTNPFEAGLGWVVKLDKAVPFIGQEALRELKAQGPQRKLIGFQVIDRGIVRPGAEVLGDDDRPVGHVTSGSTGPTVGHAIGLAYVPTEMEKRERFRLRQRGKVLEAARVAGPFYRRPA